MKLIALFKEYITADFQRYEPRPFFHFLLTHDSLSVFSTACHLSFFDVLWQMCGGGHFVVVFKDILCLFTKTLSCRITIKCKDWKRMYV